MLIMGYTTREHLLLDLDETTFLKAVSLAEQIQQSWPCVGDCLILQSSIPSKKSYLKYDENGRPWEKWVYQNYHLVFNNYIGYDKSVAIIDTLVGLDALQPEYKEIRLFRGDMTLRVSPKWLTHRTIPSPTTKLYLPNGESTENDKGIKNYVAVLKATKQLFFGTLNSQKSA